MACTYNGGVILGADSRTSTGTFVANRASDKITKLADKVYICRSGSAADTQNISMYLQYFIQQHEMELNGDIEVRAAANLAAQMAYNNKAMLNAGLIVAGWDKVHGGQVWGLPMGGTLLQLPFTIGGSGSTYILSFCDKHWRPQMTEQECRDFMVRTSVITFLALVCALVHVHFKTCLSLAMERATASLYSTTCLDNPSMDFLTSPLCSPLPSPPPGPRHLPGDGARRLLGRVRAPRHHRQGRRAPPLRAGLRGPAALRGDGDQGAAAGADAGGGGGDCRGAELEEVQPPAADRDPPLTRI
jgi:ATP-dependent protease HslVU (ClpYQ) peptidase subunit